MVACVYRRAEVVYSDVGVGRYGGYYGRVGRAELGAVGAAAYWEGLEGFISCGGPLSSWLGGWKGEELGVEGRTCKFNGTVPGAGNKGVFGDGIPADGKGLALVLVEVHDREVVHAQIEELDGAISTGYYYLVLVYLGPGEVI